MKKALFATLAMLCLGGMAQADVFNLGAGYTNLETVTVGDPGNVGNLASSGGMSRICGSVNYSYNISKYQITAKQYCDFLNAKAKWNPYGLYNSNMWTSGYGCKIQRSGTLSHYTYCVADEYANRPVNFVSFLDACRFTNWLSNGQGNGDTEHGTYTLNGYNGKDDSNIQRNTGAKWAVTSEDEWYMAAYYKGGGTDSGYWLYPTCSDTPPGRDMSDVSGNNANHGDGYAGPIDSNNYYTTVAGEFQNSESPYGTFDQGGNVYEWNETVRHLSPNYVYRGVSGSWFMGARVDLHSSALNYVDLGTESYYIGFRVSQVPEPSSFLALLGGVGALLGFSRRRK